MSGLPPFRLPRADGLKEVSWPPRKGEEFKPLSGWTKISEEITETSIVSTWRSPPIHDPSDVERLRGLIKAVELSRPGRYGGGPDDRWCPWCSGERNESGHKHADDCPAFTRSGVVR